jgi:glycosyltransferase involved in cell wall biosynthesis
MTTVLLTADAVGGVWQYALDLAHGLAERGVAVVLAVLGPAPSARQRADARAVPGLRLVETGLPLDWTAQTEGEVEEAALAIDALARELGVDLVHLHSAALARPGGGVPVVASCHSCVATWWRAVRTEPLPDTFVWRMQAMARGLQSADALVAPSAAFAQATADAYDLPRAPAVVFNGRRFGAAPARIKAAEPFAFTAGRLWDEGKNLAVLDRAAARLPAPVFAAGPLAGPNGARQRLRHAVAIGRLHDDVLATWLAAAPVFVSTALYEPFGLAVLEAAQAGCALVLSDIPTFRELWDGAALFVDPRDEAAVAAAVADVLGSPDHRETLAAAARARAARYAAAAMTDGVLGVYRSLLPGQAGRENAA